MRITMTLLAATLVGALAACQPTATDTPVAAEDGSTPNAPAAAAPVEPAPATATPPPQAGPDGDRDLAAWDGYDAMKLGMSEAQVRAAWGADLKGDAPMEGSSCFHLSPSWVKVPAEFALMFENDKFVRYSVESPDLLAPGGGKVGISRADIEALYPGNIEEQPHKYTDGHYLRIANGANVLIFEVDAAGKVTEWRVGVPPQVDYVEGCS